MACARRKRNHISKLQRYDGVVMDSQDVFCGVANSYFDVLFRKETCSMQPIFDMVQLRIIQQDNCMIFAPFIMEVFWKALFKRGDPKNVEFILVGFKSTSWKRYQLIKVGEIDNDERILWYVFSKSVWVQPRNAREARLDIRNQP